MDGRKIIKWSIKKQGWKAGTGFFWFRYGTSVRLLCTQ
jgi:hypothetical protein